MYPQKLNFLWGIPYFHPATMFKKECLSKVGGYRVTKITRRAQDYDLFMRLHASGFRGKNIKEILYLYKIDQNSYNRRDFQTRLDECLIRYEGYKNLGILLLGFPFVFKPIFAYFYQELKRKLSK